MTAAKQYLRACVFTPYRAGYGPDFRLTVWDTGVMIGNKCRLAYRLTIGKQNTAHHAVLFEGEDFGCSPLHAIDSDECMKAIMGFLTLRPGDTDSEYFANYTPAQLEYCSQHAEALACEVINRFGE